MEWHLADKSDIYLRRAIWESYDKKCVYCGIALEPRHMQIDHIIPVDERYFIENSDSDIQVYLNELKRQGFDKNTIENYALTCSDCNNKKHNFVFSATNLRFYHENAARHYQQINKKYNRYIKKMFPDAVIEEKEYCFRQWDGSELVCEKTVISAANQVRFL